MAKGGGNILFRPDNGEKGVAEPARDRMSATNQWKKHDYRLRHLSNI